MTSETYFLTEKSDGMNGGVIEGNEIGTQGHTGNSKVFGAKELKTEFRRAIQIIFSCGQRLRAHDRFFGA
jgi:hypothetical protein